MAVSASFRVYRYTIAIKALLLVIIALIWLSDFNYTSGADFSSNENKLTSFVTDTGGVMTYDSVEIKPEFPGGLKAFYELLRKNLRYPVEALNNRITGEIFVRFIIEKNGSVSGVTALRAPGHGVGEEAERIVQLSPDWSPGSDNGRKVRVMCILPIHFIPDINNFYVDHSPPIAVDTNSVMAKVTANTGFIFNAGYTQPEFLGGKSLFYSYLYKTIIYPEHQLNKDTTVAVRILFVVEKDGKLSDIKPLKGDFNEFDRAAIRAVKTISVSNKWIPGTFNGKDVRIRYLAALSFLKNGLEVSRSSDFSFFQNSLIIVNGREARSIPNKNNIDQIIYINAPAARVIYGKKGREGAVVITTF